MRRLLSMIPIIGACVAVLAAFPPSARAGQTCTRVMAVGTDGKYYCTDPGTNCCI
jgi:hypothetical protein